jgi:hypothetical protein
MTFPIIPIYHIAIQDSYGISFLACLRGQSKKEKKYCINASSPTFFSFWRQILPASLYPSLYFSTYTPTRPQILFRDKEKIEKLAPDLLSSNQPRSTLPACVWTCIACTTNAIGSLIAWTHMWPHVKDDVKKSPQKRSRQQKNSLPDANRVCHFPPVISLFSPTQTCLSTIPHSSLR